MPRTGADITRVYSIASADERPAPSVVVVWPGGDVSLDHGGRDNSRAHRSHAAQVLASWRAAVQRGDPVAINRTVWLHGTTLLSNRWIGTVDIDNAY